MEVNLQLIESTGTGLAELHEIVLEKELDKKIVSTKMEEVIKKLNQLNDVKESYKAKLNIENLLEEESRRRSQAINEIAEYRKGVSQLTDEIKNDTEGVHAEAIERKSKSLLWGNDKLQSIGQALQFDSELFQYSLTYEMKFHLAKRRKEWLWITNNIFRFYNFIIIIIKIIVSTSIGFLLGAVVNKFFPQIPEYVSGIFLGIAAYFTTDRKIDDYLDKRYWKINGNWVLALLIHFENYTSQLNYLIKLYYGLPNKAPKSKT